ncbi:MAG: hypothetical protein IJJ23_04785 [Clostridia bacterium]|nr:hypothetical protein [Clostridia bacterium]
MKKRILSALLAVAMLLTMVALAETPTQPAEEYIGTWVSDRVTLSISREDDKLTASVFWANSAFEMVTWYYPELMYDEVADEYNTFENGTSEVITCDEEGKEVSTEVLFEDGAAAFRLRDGVLTWVDYKKAPGENECVLEPAVEIAVAAQPDEFAERFFRVIAGVEQGTAGSSLKLCEAARDAALFAVDYEMWNPDVEAIRANMLEAWNSLTDEQRSAFDSNFMDVVTLMDGCFEDWDANRPQFEDAGAADDMDMVIYDPLNRLAWENLKAYTLTLGNSDGI